MSPQFVKKSLRPKTFQLTKINSIIPKFIVCFKLQFDNFLKCAKIYWCLIIFFSDFALSWRYLREINNRWLACGCLINFSTIANFSNNIDRCIKVFSLVASIKLMNLPEQSTSSIWCFVEYLEWNMSFQHKKKIIKHQ